MNPEHPDTRSLWDAINAAREREAAHAARTAVLESQYQDLKGDIDGLGDKVEKGLGGLESRILARLEKRDRTLFAVLTIVIPVGASIIGALIGRGSL